MYKIVGIYSPAPGSGKTTLARAVAHSVVPFAATVKDMVRALLYALNGADDDMTNRMMYGDLKEQGIPGIEVTPRYLMQTIGTDWGRNLVDKDLWVNVWKGRVNAMKMTSSTIIVADDMRFDNEMDAIQSMGGTCIWLERPGIKNEQAHVSEGSLDRRRNEFNIHITNDGRVDDLLQRGRELRDRLCQI